MSENKTINNSFFLSKFSIDTSVESYLELSENNERVEVFKAFF